MDELNSSNNAIIEELPDMDRILREISELKAATHDDFLELNQRIDSVYQRVEQHDAALAEIPSKYASAEAVQRALSSQTEYETRSRQLTEQVASLVNVQADSQKKFATIETELTTLRAQVGTMTREFTTLNGNLTTFMTSQRERLDNQQTTITEVRNKTEALAGKVGFIEVTQEDAERRYNNSHLPLRDYVLGSETQEGLKTTIARMTNELASTRTAISSQTAEFALTSGYVKALQAKEEARRNFYQRARIQLATPKGIIAVIFAIVFFFMVINAFSLDQLFARLGQFFVLTGILKAG